MTAAKLSIEERYHREVAKQPYEFPWAGRTWKLPHIGSLDYRLQKRISEFDKLDIDELDGLFDKMLGKDQAAAWAETDVPGDFLVMVFMEWTEYSGEKPGEDSASSGSSTNTGTSSRRTSGASTTSASPKRSSAKKTPAKKAPRKRAPSAAQLAQQADAAWIAKHQALAGSPSGSS